MSDAPAQRRTAQSAARWMALRGRIMLAAAGVAGSTGELLLLAAFMAVSAWR